MTVGLIAATDAARAQDEGDVVKEIQQLRDQIGTQRKTLDEQQERLKRLELKLQQQNAPALDLQGARGGQAPPATAQSSTPAPSPVGEAPPAKPLPELQALVEVGGVLLPRRRLSLEPSFEYDNFQENRFFFAGTEIVNAVFIGGFQATNARRNTLIAAATARYGITNRAQIDLRVPYVYRSDRVTDPNGVNTTVFNSVYGNGLGDIELLGHYQLNSAAGGGAYYVANFRAKSDSGRGPFDVPYSATGFQERLPTGSGFWAVEPSLTVLYPSDPVVVFGNLGYAYAIPKDIGKTINTTTGPSRVGEVKPGGTLRGSFGLGFALNDSFSLSLGYEQDWVRSSSEVLNGVTTRSEELQIGQFLFGLSYVLSPKSFLNVNVAVGATRDAPDARFLVTLPIGFDL